jgi:hypothetical protein
LIKTGTVKELAKFEGIIDGEVYNTALRIVTILDEVYGSARDVDNNDGGFVLIVENVQDLELLKQRYMALDKSQYEVVDVVKSKKRLYINAFYLCNNEFGINVFIPMDIAPQTLLKDISRKVK